MCLLAIQIQACNSTPVMLAANREESYDRTATPPVFHDASPRVVCGIDERSGGTWLGVNQYGLIVAVTNRPSPEAPEDSRSRGTLCQMLLQCTSASVAERRAESRLAKHRYAGVNVICVDAHSAYVVYGGDEIESIELEPGLHLISDGDINDENDARLQLAREMFEREPINDADRFLNVATKVMSYKADVEGDPGIIVSGEDRGTVSSTLITLANFRKRSTYHFAQGPPDRVPYRDCSAHLHKVLGA